jgi:chromosome partitioning protein
MYTIALFHLKGGVGKTTSAVALAMQAGFAGQRCLLWDLDPQGAASWMLGVGAEHKQKALFKGQTHLGQFIQPGPIPNLDVLPADFNLRKADGWLAEMDKPAQRLQQVLSMLSEQYSLCIIDMPAGLGHMAELVLKQADLVLLPLVPSPLNLQATALLHGKGPLLKCRQTPLAFFNRIDLRLNQHKQCVLNPPAACGAMLRTVVKQHAAIEQLASGKQLPEADAAVWTLYRDLWGEVQEHMAQDQQHAVIRCGKTGA